MDDLAIYVHWPFCRSKCPYCDFNSHVAETIDDAAWRDAYLRELNYVKSLTGPRQVTSVFFGGGTPSLMEPATTAAVLGEIGSIWAVSNDAEITLEANPTSVETARLQDFRQAGINRLSLGVQSLDDAALKFLGRQHSVSETRAAIDVAASIFDRWSMDLIYARPGQSPEAWARELSDALAYDPGHVSAYQLTIEKGTPFFTAHRGGGFVLPDDDAGADLYAVTNEGLADHGLAQYEISNYARPGQESRHNLAYWRYRDYAGIGPGAHGRLTLNGSIHATRQIAAPANWLGAVVADGHGTQADDSLDASTVFEEFVLMGLRMNAGIRRVDVAARTGRDFDAVFDATTTGPMIEAGYLQVDDERMWATDEGRLRLNALISALIQ